MGLKIKLGKSELVPVGLVPEVEELAIIYGFRRIIAANSSTSGTNYSWV